jgi:hypothetical protein
MTDHPCATCLNWWECNGVAWGTPDCPKSPEPVREASAPPRPKIDPYLYDDKTESGLLEED